MTTHNPDENRPTGVYDAALAYNSDFSTTVHYDVGITNRYSSPLPSSAAGRQTYAPAPRLFETPPPLTGSPRSPSEDLLFSIPLAGRHGASSLRSEGLKMFPSTTNASSRRKTVTNRKMHETGTSTLWTGVRSHRSWIPSQWSGVLLLTVVLEALAVIGLVGAVFAKLRLDTRAESRVQDLKTVSVFFTITIFAMCFLLFIALDALRLKNTIQVIGVAVFNIAVLITAILEIGELKKALRLQDESGAGVQCSDDPKAICNGIRDLYPSVEKLMIATTVLIGVAQIPLMSLCYILWLEWGWRIYKMIGADVILRRCYLYYQVLVVFLKFDFFFGCAFCIAYLILVVSRNDWEYGVTIAAVPLAILALFLCALSVRREILSAMVFSIICFIAGGVYFVYKITRIYDPSTAAQYRTVRLTLTFFSIFSILSLLCTIANAVVCLGNFDKGLKEAHNKIGHFSSKRQKPEQRNSLDVPTNIYSDGTPTGMSDEPNHTTLAPGRQSLD